MDKHHVAHYGIGAALAASVGAVFHFMPATPTTWPTLTATQAVDVVVGMSQVLGTLGTDKPILIYCIDRDCNKITVALRQAGAKANVKVVTDRPMSVEDGLSVGADTQEKADALAKAVKDATNGLLAPDPVDKHPSPYLSFGHFAAE